MNSQQCLIQLLFGKLLHCSFGCSSIITTWDTH